jgi:hypothetical protein
MGLMGDRLRKCIWPRSGALRIAPGPDGVRAHPSAKDVKAVRGGEQRQLLRRARELDPPVKLGSALARTSCQAQGSAAPQPESKARACLLVRMTPSFRMTKPEPCCVNPPPRGGAGKPRKGAVLVAEQVGRRAERRAALRGLHERRHFDVDDGRLGLGRKGCERRRRLPAATGLQSAAAGRVRLGTV